MFDYNIIIKNIIIYIVGFNLYINESINSNLNYNNILNFISVNKIILVFLIIVYLGILFDETFRFRNKIFIFLYIIIFLLFVSIFKDNFFINEIFWYSLILNGSFIFHICICDWIYRFSVYIDNKNLGFLITRISLIFSMSFVLFLLHLIYLKLVFYRHKNKMYGELNILNSFKLSYDHIFNIIFIILKILMKISIFFITLFINYVLILKGLIKHRLSLKEVGGLILFIIVTLIISIFVLGIPRLYFVWIILFIRFIYKELKLKEFNIVKFYFGLNIMFDSDFKCAYWSIMDNYKAINSKGFNSGFINLLNYTEIFTLRLFVGDFYIWHYMKQIFINYGRKTLILIYGRSYLIESFSACGGGCYPKDISKYHIEWAVERTWFELDLNKEEEVFLDCRLRKLYKKTLNI